MAMGNWELNDRGSTPSVNHSADAEYTPVQYPRSDANRGQVSHSNKGAASANEAPLDAVAQDTTGNVNVPRHMGDVQYEVGPYPVVDDGAEGVDEGDGASR